MEEDGSIKAPVTRMRRRLSVEQNDDTKSPSTPSTPTKKRSARVATKPQLDLIDENEPDATGYESDDESLVVIPSPQKWADIIGVSGPQDIVMPGNTASDNTPKIVTRKTKTKDVLEEEKPLTPSRRSVRIKSNTSIVAVTPQALDSPRAKRAARRNSQIESDSEAPLTPARQTRRTRKNSSSSIDQQDAVLHNKTSTITESIAEEIEANDNNTKTYTDTDKENSVHLSPKSKSIAGENNYNNNNDSEIKDSLNSVNKKNMCNSEPFVMLNPLILQYDNEGTVNLVIQKSSTENSKLNIVDTSVNTTFDNNINVIDVNKSTARDEVNYQVSSTADNKKHSEKLKLSESAANLLSKLDLKPKKKSTINKSASYIEDTNNIKSKRCRTKSWTNASQASLPNNHLDFYSDNEIVKANKKTKNTSEAHDIFKKTDSIGNYINRNKEECIVNKAAILTDRCSITIVPHEVDTIDNKHSDERNSSNFQSDQISEVDLLRKAPVSAIQSTVYFEDSDTESKRKSKNKNLSDNEDQCVPVINNNFDINNSLKTSCIDTLDLINKKKNSSIAKMANQKSGDNSGCEPMDIDESVPNTSIINISNNSLQICVNDKDINKKRHSSQDVTNLNNSNNNLSHSKSQNLEKTQNENKSTLILSQLKDESTTGNNMTKSPVHRVNGINNIDDDGKKIDKKNISHDYSTSTPLQEKTLRKRAMQINTSVINKSNTESKDVLLINKDKIKKKTKKYQNLDTTAQDNSDSEEESYSHQESNSERKSTRKKTSFLDDEPEEASDDYESGDSRDEDERQYEKENEIIDKGETLDSDDVVTDDTDYEKDSFVVSSDEEDNELLDGSGDDLSMSDNELTMSKKSKNKYNERKNKEQKNASREMFESRHNISKSERLNSKKANRQRLDSSSIYSEEELKAASKKRKRLRLSSTQELDTDELNIKKNNGLADSVLNVSANKEPEISMHIETDLEKGDPLEMSMQMKLEPKTPQKNLDITTVPIIDDVEEIEINVNLSMGNVTYESSDPLQNVELDENDSLSEDGEIIVNYDSILKDLNNIKDLKIKVNRSLDSNKNNNEKSNDPIIDQLNLTQNKKSKKTNKHSLSNGKELQNIKGNEKPKEFDNDDSSNSIDLKLLFSEDSMDTENNATDKNSVVTSNSKEYIPLKKSEGKTNIPNDITVIKEHNFSFSNEKTKNRKSLSSMEDFVHNQEDELLPVFIDTIGARGDDLPENMSLNTSKKKKNKTERNLSMNCEQVNETLSDTFNDSVTDKEQSTKKKKKKKRHNISVNTSQVVAVEDNKINEEEDMSESTSVSAANKSLNVSLENSAKKKKKHNTSTRDTSQQLLEKVILTDNKMDEEENMSESTNVNAANKSLNLSLGDSAKNKKNKKHNTSNLDTSQQVAETGKKLHEEQHTSTSNVANKSLNVSLEDSAKKKKKKKHNTSTLDTSQQVVEKDRDVHEEEDMSEATSFSAATNSLIVSLENSAKKKKKNQHNTSTLDTSLQVAEKDNDVHKKEDISEGTSVTATNKSLNVSLEDSAKKKKKNKHNTTLDTPQQVSDKGKKINEEQHMSTSNVANKSLNVSLEDSAEKKKKKKRDISTLDISKPLVEKDEILDAGSTTISNILETNTKKKNKKKQSTSFTGYITSENVIQDATDDAPLEVPFESHKKSESDNLVIESMSNTMNTKSNDKSSTEVNLHNSLGSGKKKRKSKTDASPKMAEDILTHSVSTDEVQSGKKRKRNVSPSTNTEENLKGGPKRSEVSNELLSNSKNKKRKLAHLEDINEEKDTNPKKVNKKRKERDGDEESKSSKIFKKNSSDKVSVPRLPSAILNQIDAKPKQEILDMKKSKITSTTQFQVQEIIKRKNKPSNFLEESVYLNHTKENKKQKRKMKIPKVLPFIPSASTSGNGFTTNFQINVIPKETKFIAETANIKSFKNEYLYGKKIKRLGTYEMYKKQRNVKMSKF
ncbi:putative uncharacterized protein DDB_G0282133 isoform X2 [Achroia grisella]|uniref:putative uncharacterized protein DDB_G0282133 isoform X2 n=1 Tax=Achroia grisella TaxID=688607 RepID=UPI0027D25AD7|nr:putative uncharacterized protein DDB_G0282133 isoform X2 [Achroia grisella]